MKTQTCPDEVNGVSCSQHSSAAGLFISFFSSSYSFKSFHLQLLWIWQWTPLAHGGIYLRLTTMTLAMKRRRVVKHDLRFFNMGTVSLGYEEEIQIDFSKPQKREHPVSAQTVVMPRISNSLIPKSQKISAERARTQAGAQSLEKIKLSRTSQRSEPKQFAAPNGGERAWHTGSVC